MSIPHLPQPSPALQEPLWLPAPRNPTLPVNELHIWRIRMEEPRDTDPVSSHRAEELQAALFRNDILGRYAGAESPFPGAMTRLPAAGLRVAIAQCDQLALFAVSRNVRRFGLDLERIRQDIPFEEMAGGFLDVRAQWDLRTTWSQREKAWKFFQFWTSNEACAQARPPSQAAHSCHVRGFSPEADFIAALAVQGGPEAGLHYWDWQC